jgi:predicted nucleotidyltransferase
MKTAAGKLDDATRERLASYCVGRQIQRLAIFGSMADGRGRADSDLDLLLTFMPGVTVDQELMIAAELEDVAGRPISVVDERLLARTPNPHKCRAILESATVIYDARQ